MAVLVNGIRKCCEHIRAQHMIARGSLTFSDRRGIARNPCNSEALSKRTFLHHCGAHEVQFHHRSCAKYQHGSLTIGSINIISWHKLNRFVSDDGDGSSVEANRPFIPKQNGPPPRGGGSAKCTELAVLSAQLCGANAIMRPDHLWCRCVSDCVLTS